METEVDIKDKKYIVIDTGSGCIKAGYSGEDTPRCIIPTVIGSDYYAEKNNQGEDYQREETKMGAKLNLDAPGQSNLIKPVQRLPKIPEIPLCNVLIIDGPLQKESRKETIQFWLDELKVSNIAFMNSSVLSLFSTGRTRGLTIEVGDGVCSAVPIFEGFGLPHAIRQLSFGGTNLTEFIHAQLMARGIQLSQNQWFVSQNIKEKMLRVLKDNENINAPDLLDEEQRSFELPDGNIIQVDKDIRITASEAFFNPRSILSNLQNPLIDGSEGIIDIAIDCINLCDNDLKQELLSNIVLSGGSTMIPGFQDRVEKELFKQLHKSVNRQDVAVWAFSTRKFGVWVGGSMVASLATFTEFAISKTEYDEKGDPHKYQIALEKSF